MSTSLKFDAWFRRSIIFKYLPWFKRRFSFLFKVAKSGYEKVLSSQNSSGLAYYQYVAVNRFLTVTDIQEKPNSTVLEIGSDLSATVLGELAGQGITKCYGINPAFSDDDLLTANEKLGASIDLSCGDVRGLNFDDASMDAIFSVAVFEHLLDFDDCLEEMFRVLKPGGYVYAHFGPIWSSSIGHHVYAKVGELEARHWKPESNPVADYSHLYMSKEEMRNDIQAKAHEDLLQPILDWIYDSEDINRVFYEEYIQSFENSRFEIVSIIDEKEKVPNETLARLKDANPSFKEFAVRNCEVVLHKCA